MKVRILLLVAILAYPQLATSGDAAWLVPNKLTQASYIEVDQILVKLQSKNHTERVAAKQQLLHMANSSVEVRSQVITRLVSLLEDRALLEATDDRSQVWYYSAQVLGDLKAQEAIEVLVQHLDYNNGVMGLSIGHYPALRAIVDIGKPAVPKLTQALLENPEVEIRINAVTALMLIGGQDAKQALKRALLVETDKDVLRHIQYTLKQKSTK